MQSPFDNEFPEYVKASPNMWAVPCDNNPECENGEDENDCSVDEKNTFFGLFAGYFIISIAMLSTLLYMVKRYILIFISHFKVLSHFKV